MVIDHHFPADFSLPDASRDASYAQHGAKVRHDSMSSDGTILLGNGRYKAKMRPGWLGGGPKMDKIECLYLPYAARCGYRPTLASLAPSERKLLRLMAATQIARGTARPRAFPPDLRPFEVQFFPKPGNDDSKFLDAAKHAA